MILADSESHQSYTAKLFNWETRAELPLQEKDGNIQIHHLNTKQTAAKREAVLSLLHCGDISVHSKGGSSCDCERGSLSSSLRSV